MTAGIPQGADASIVNDVTAAAAAARGVLKKEEKAVWDAYKRSIGLNPETALSDVKVPVAGELRTTLRQLSAESKAAIDPDDAAGLSRLQPKALTENNEVDLWQLQQYIGGLKRRQRIMRQNEVASDPSGRDIDRMITAAQNQRDEYLRETNPALLDTVLDAEAKTKQRAELFDNALVGQLLRRENGEWMLTDAQLIGGVIGSGDAGVMEHLVAAMSKHPAGIPTLQDAMLKVYRNEVIEDGIPNAALHKRWMEKHEGALNALFPGRGSARLRGLGSFEKEVTQRIKRFEKFEKAVQKSFRGRIQDISPEKLVNKLFTEQFDIGDVGKLVNLADAAGVGELYRSAVRSQIKSKFHSTTGGININSLSKFLEGPNKDKIIRSLGGRYYRDMQLLVEGLETARRSETGIATTRRPGLLATVSEGLARATVARPLSPHGVALTRAINFHQRARNRAWAELVENPDTLRTIIANRNLDVQSQDGARILGLIGGGALVMNPADINIDELQEDILREDNN